MLPVFDRKPSERKVFLFVFFTKRIVTLIAITRVTYHNFVAVTSAIAGVQSAKTTRQERNNLTGKKIILKVKCCSLNSFFLLFLNQLPTSKYAALCSPSKFLYPSVWNGFWYVKTYIHYTHVCVWVSARS